MSDFDHLITNINIMLIKYNKYNFKPHNKNFPNLPNYFL